MDARMTTLAGRLYADLAAGDESECKTALTAAEAPSLAELWGNPLDAVYDRW
jgi:hypothetical protein